MAFGGRAKSQRPGASRGIWTSSIFARRSSNCRSDQREALILIGASGLSYDEAAAICGCAPGTMKSRVNRARNRLAEMLALVRLDSVCGDWQATMPRPRADVDSR